MAGKELGKILYVEDEPDIRTVALMALETVGGFTVKACSSGQEAVEAASDFAPDLVILDVMMPGMDGYEMCRRLKANEKTKGIPVIFVTAKSEVEDENEGFQVGAVDYITKPISP
ncbi:MAG: response regulator, partial [Thiohalobacterales bacterium]|nr:response regulator [Thiohalobacterales bacterium]